MDLGMLQDSIRYRSKTRCDMHKIFTSWRRWQEACPVRIELINAEHEKQCTLRRSKA
jgi:hypothetical protein